jgi:hypothetical protein
MRSDIACLKTGGVLRKTSYHAMAQVGWMFTWAERIHNVVRTQMRGTVA